MAALLEDQRGAASTRVEMLESALTKYKTGGIEEGRGEVLAALARALQQRDAAGDAERARELRSEIVIRGRGYTDGPFIEEATRQLSAP